jgi:transcriptional regulator with XRE-family HTH domain
MKKMTPKSERKTYTNVVDMVREDLGDEFADALAKRIAERDLVKELFVLRNVKGLTQKALADRMGCTQSRVSKLESARDVELSLGDVKEYLDALGYEVRLTIAPKADSPARKSSRRPKQATEAFHVEVIRPGPEQVTEPANGAGKSAAGAKKARTR